VEDIAYLIIVLSVLRFTVSQNICWLF